MVYSKDIEQIDRVENNSDELLSNTELGKVTTWSLVKVVIISWFALSNAFNYATMMGVGYGYSLYPALKDIYKNNPERLATELSENSTFFNCSGTWTPLILALHIKMLEAGSSTRDAIIVKLSLMGPLAGIGDTLYAFTLVPVFTIIGVQLSQDGNPVGVFINIFGLTAYALAITITVMVIGIKMGEKIVDNLAQTMKTITMVSSIIGITVVIGLALSFVKFNLDISWSQGIGDGGVKENSIKDILDKLAPNLLPLSALATFTVLISKFKWSIIKIILFTFVVSLVGATVGFITPM